jgi:hypothetical protein
VTLFGNGTSQNDTLEELECNIMTEEMCFDDWFNAISCSLISDGGCPCREGYVRCGADLANGNVGYCTEACCDLENEYICSEDLQPPDTGGIFKPTKFFCGTIEDGCACPEGQQECVELSGFCSNVCCDQVSEEHCYGPDNTSYCAKIADGGCPCPKGQERCGADLNNHSWLVHRCLLQPSD